MTEQPGGLGESGRISKITSLNVTDELINSSGQRMQMF